MANPVVMEYRTVDTSGLGLGAAEPFRFRWALPGEDGSGEKDDVLIRSIGSAGIISPPVLAVSGNKFKIVSGFRRIAAAREAGLHEIPALITDPSRSLAVWLETSIHGAPLSEMERLTLAAKASALAGEGIEDILPFLSAIFGRRITAGLATRLAGLTGLNAPVRLAIHEGRLSPGDLLQLDAHPGIELETAAELLASSGLSRSARREALRGMLSIADMGKDAFAGFAAGFDPGSISLDDAISSLIHPRIKGDLGFLHRVIEDIELPPSASVRIPENLEGGSCTVEIRIRGEDELRISLSRLEEALEDGLIEEMLKVLQGRG